MSHSHSRHQTSSNILTARRWQNATETGFPPAMTCEFFATAPFLPSLCTRRTPHISLPEGQSRPFSHFCIKRPDVGVVFTANDSILPSLSDVDAKTQQLHDIRPCTQQQEWDSLSSWHPSTSPFSPFPPRSVVSFPFRTSSLLVAITFCYLSTSYIIKSR